MNQEATVAELRQANHAHQTQNAFLASEVMVLPPFFESISLIFLHNIKIKKLEREHAIEIASRDEQISALHAQLEALQHSSSPDQSVVQAEFLTLQKLC